MTSWKEAIRNEDGEDSVNDELALWALDYGCKTMGEVVKVLEAVNGVAFQY